jgi:hypothetical protein
MGSRQPDWSAKPVLPRDTSVRVARSPPISNYLIFDNLFEFGKLAERQRQQAVTLHAVSALRGWFDSSTSHHMSKWRNW